MLMNENQSEKNSDFVDSAKLSMEAPLEYSINQDDTQKVHSDPSMPLLYQEELKPQTVSISKPQENPAPESPKILSADAQSSISPPALDAKVELNPSEIPENSAEISELAKKFEQDLQLSTDCSLSQEKEKEKISESSKFVENLEEDDRSDSQAKENVVESEERFSDNQTLDDIKRDIEHWNTCQGIAKMVGCFRILLDKRLKKVKKVNQMSNQDQPTRIALEIIPLFEKFSCEYLDGAVSLCYNSSRAWVRGLKFTEDLDNTKLEELRTQALTQGFYLKLVRKGYLKAVYTRL